MHTSTVTVAVLPEVDPQEFRLNESELEETTTKGSGPGGQHRNKTESAVVLKHKPTGTTVRVEAERSQHRNRDLARKLLAAKLSELDRQRAAGARAEDRKRQVGSGMRGDKRRTIRYQDGQVNDHVTGRTWRLKDYLRGEW